MDRGQIGPRLFDRHARLHSADRTQSPSLEDLWVLAKREPHVGVTEQSRGGRQNTDDLDRISVDRHRAAEDVRSRVDLDGIEYVGNHGRERLRSGGEPGADDTQTKQRLRALSEAFEDKLGAIPGIYLENKGLTLAVHFRQTPELRHTEVKQRVDEVARAFADGFHVSEGKMVFDVVPADQVDKGSIALDMVRERGGLDRALPIYCGDDTTDETVFRALPEKALTVCVGGPEKQSAARYRVDGPDEVSAFLDRILACRRGQSRP